MARRAAEAGFTGFEAELVMLGSDWSIPELGSTLDRHGLRLAALVLAEAWLGAVETADERRRADLLIRAVAELRGSRLVLVPLPGADRSDAAARQVSAMACMAAVAQRAADAGVIATFHPNSPAGSAFRTADDYGRMDELWPEGLMYTPDIGHIVRGGMDPVEVMSARWDRVDHVHVKDVDADGRWRPTGDGVADVPRVLSFLSDRGYDGWVTFEEESPEAEQDPDGATLANGRWIDAWRNR